MPHVNVRMYAGRSEEDKARLAEAIGQALIQTLGSSERSISVAIEDVAPDAKPALAIGALALGAVAVGAMAIGALAIGRPVVGRARFKDLRIDRLVVDELVVKRRRGAV